MLRSSLLLAFLMASLVTTFGCGGSAPPPTGATREAAIEQHRAMANREMQSIQSSRTEERSSQQSK